jgi:hypothetical protein
MRIENVVSLLVANFKVTVIRIRETSEKLINYEGPSKRRRKWWVPITRLQVCSLPILESKKFRPLCLPRRSIYRYMTSISSQPTLDTHEVQCGHRTAESD